MSWTQLVFHACGLLAALGPSVLFVPILYAMMREVACKAGPEDSCWAGVSAVERLFSALTAAAWCTFNALFAFSFAESSAPEHFSAIMEKDVRARESAVNFLAVPHGKLELLDLSARGAVAVLFALLSPDSESDGDGSGVLLGIVLMMASAFLAYLCIRYLAASHPVALHQRCVSAAICSWAGVACLVSRKDNDANDAAGPLLFYVGAPVVAAAALLALRARVFSLRFYMPVESLSSVLDAETKVRVVLHAEQMQNSGAKDDSEKDCVEAGIVRAAQLVEELLARWPTESVALLCAARFEFLCRGNALRGLRALHTLEASDHSVLEQYALFSELRFSETRSSKEPGAECIRSYLAFVQAEEAGKAAMAMAHEAQLQFWTEMHNDQPSTAALERIGERINASVTHAGKELRTALQIYGESASFLRTMALFHRTLLNDASAAMEYERKACDLDMKRRERMREANENGSLCVTDLELTKNVVFSDQTAVFAVSGDVEHCGQVISANLAANELLGRTTQELLASNIATVLPDCFRDHHNGFLSRYISTGVRHLSDRSNLSFVQHKAGFLRLVNLYVRTIIDGTTVPKFLGLLVPVETSGRDSFLLVDNESGRVHGATPGIFFDSLRSVSSATRSREAATTIPARSSQEDSSIVRFSKWAPLFVATAELARRSTEQSASKKEKLARSSKRKLVRGRPLDATVESAAGSQDAKRKEEDEFNSALRSAAGVSLTVSFESGDKRFQANLLSISVGTSAIDIVKLTCLEAEDAAQEPLSDDSLGNGEAEAEALSAHDDESERKGANGAKSARGRSEQVVAFAVDGAAEESDAARPPRLEAPSPSNSLHGSDVAQHAEAKKAGSPSHAISTEDQGGAEPASPCRNSTIVASSEADGEQGTASGKKQRTVKKASADVASLHSAASSSSNFQTGMDRIRQSFLNQNEDLESTMRWLRMALIATMVMLGSLALVNSLLSEARFTEFEERINYIERAGVRRSEVVRTAYATRSLILANEGLVDVAAYNTTSRALLRESATSVRTISDFLYYDARRSEELHDVYTRMVYTSEELVATDSSLSLVNSSRNLYDFSNIFDGHAQVLVNVELSRFTKRNHHVYFVLQNAVNDLFRGFNESALMYVRAARGRGAAVRNEQTIVLACIISVTTLVAVFVFRPTIAKAEETRDFVFQMFSEVPEAAIAELQAQAEETMRESAGEAARTPAADTGDVDAAKKSSRQQSSSPRSGQRRRKDRTRSFKSDSTQKRKLLLQVSVLLALAAVFFCVNWTLKTSEFQRVTDYLVQINWMRAVGALAVYNMFSLREYVIAGAMQHEFRPPDAAHIAAGLGESVTYMLDTMNNVLYGAAWMEMKQTVRTSKLFDSIYFSDLCPHIGNPPNCRTIAAGILREGLNPSSEEYVHLLRRVALLTERQLADAQAANASANAHRERVLAMLSNNTFLETEQMGVHYVYRGFSQAAAAILKHNSTRLAALKDLSMIMTVFFIIFLVLLWFCLYSRLVRRLDGQLKRTRAMLLLVPTSILENSKHLRLLLRQTDL